MKWIVMNNRKLWTEWTDMKGELWDERDCNE